MKKLNLDFVVGLFLIGGFLAFAYVSLHFGEFSFLSLGEYYHISAKFNDVSGLKEGANVEIAGVNVGRVQHIRLAEDDRAVVTMQLPQDVEVTEDAIASIRTQGIIGDKYVRILQGGAEEVLKSGGVIIETESAVDLEELVSKYIFGDV